MRSDFKPSVWSSKFAGINNILRMQVFYKAFFTKSKQISLCGEHVRLSVCLLILLSILSKISIEIFILKNRRASLGPVKIGPVTVIIYLRAQNELQPNLGEIQSKRSASNSAARLWV